MTISEIMRLLVWFWFFIATPLLIIFLIILHLEVDAEENKLKEGKNNE